MRSLAPVIHSTLVALAAMLAIGAEVSAARTFQVNSTTDAVDQTPGDGNCRTSNRVCTLRAAIQEANAFPGADVVQVRSGTYTLTRSGSTEPTGDLDVTAPLTISGASAANTILDAGSRPSGAPVEFRGIDRLLELHPAAGNVTITAVTLRDGSTAGRGGGLLSATAGRARLESVVVTTGYAAQGGGGVAADGAGTLELVRSTISDNLAGTDGGALAAGAGTLVVESSTLSGNTARAGAGGLSAAGGATARTESATVHANTAPAVARTPGLGALTLRNTIVSGGCAGAIASAGGNLDTGATCALAGPGDRSAADPRLDPLAANSGTTPSHALRRGSRAIDAGLSPCPAVDQRGRVRPQGAGCDTGAFEAAPFPPDGAAPETSITAHPGTLTAEKSATFRFTGTDDVTAPVDLRFECRLDGAPVWAPCVSPATYSGLGEGAHAFEVRARDELGNADPSPARHAWTVDGCGGANVSAAAVADSWIDEGDTGGNKGSDSTLKVQSKVGVNWRALVRFALPAAAPEGCVVESARLRIYSPGGADGSILEARQLSSAWQEGSVTWANQPGTVGVPRTAHAGEGYLTWSVTSQVQAMLDAGAHHGFLIKDAEEDSETGGSSEFHSREKGEEPPQLVVRFAPPPSGPPPPPAAPVEASVSCGQELTASTKLLNDLTDCGTGDGLVIGAHRIIVDLNGHTVDGVGLGSGIRNDGYAGVIVRNGTVRDWDHGVQLQAESRDSVVRDLLLEGNEVAGVQLATAGPGNEIRSNRLTANGDGIMLVAGTFGSLVADNVLTLNCGAQLHVEDSDGNRLERNAIDGGGGGDLGIAVLHASHNTLKGNTVTGTSDAGLSVADGADGNRLEGNVLTAAGDAGIEVGLSDGNTLVGNVVRDNPTGFEIGDARGNVLEANEISGNGTGIELAPGTVENHVVRNVVTGSGASGIQVSEEALDAPGNHIERNAVAGNAGDGIVTDKAGHRLTANVATGNGGYGISAAAGTIDGGGNVATGNGAGQCRGVVCAGTPPVDPPPDPDPDTTPPETTVTGATPLPGGGLSIAFEGTDETSGADDLDFECSLDGAAFAACTSPYTAAAPAPGDHLLRVRARDAAGNLDPSPAPHAWTLAPPAVTCPPDVTLAANADAWIDENSATANKGDDSVLKVQSKGSDDFRALVRFGLPAVPEGCRVASATLRLFADAARTGRSITATALASAWTETGVTWQNQPATTGAPAAVPAARGYREWNVTGQVQAGAAHGFLIRDAAESGSGFEQAFLSREKGESPPQLVLRFAPIAFTPLNAQ